MRCPSKSRNAKRLYPETVAPRGFDVSPYFEIIQPTLALGFDYRTMVWDDDAGPEA